MPEPMGVNLAAFRRPVLASLIVAVIALAAPAVAHHAYAMFDPSKEVKLTGVIRAFGWTNPHSWIEIEVVGPAGPQVWGVECNSPSSLARVGWTSSSLKPGDKVTLSIHPLRDGGHGGSFVSVTLANGRTLREPASLAGGELSHP